MQNENMKQNKYSSYREDSFTKRNTYFLEESIPEDSSFQGYYKKRKVNQNIQSIQNALCVAILLYPILYIPLKIYQCWEERKCKVYPE
jgi:hypothetical protein